MIKRHIAPMWETTNALYHYSDRDRASHLEGEEPVEVWVGVPNDFFIGTWQLKDQFEGWIFKTEEEADEEVKKHNHIIDNGY